MRSFLERLVGKRPRANPEPPANDDESILADMRDQIRRDVAAGFDDSATIARSAVEVFESEMPAESLQPHAQAFVEDAIADHINRQQSWPAPTDCDRLDAAFSALESQGIVARQHFSCCGTCGSSEIWDEIDAFGRGGGRARGYAFYHVQDTDGAVEGGGLFLNYGACEDGEAQALGIGREIVAALEQHGLRTDWDGSWNRRIGVTLDWKRRWPAVQ